MRGLMMSNRQRRKERKKNPTARARTSGKLRKVKVGKLPRGMSKMADSLSTGRFSGRAFSFRKSQGGPSGRPRGKSRIWYEGDPQIPTPKEGSTVSRTFQTKRANLKPGVQAREQFLHVPGVGLCQRVSR